MVTCTNCGENYRRKKAYMYEKYESLCANCTDLVEKIQENSLPPDQVVYGYKLLVTYDVTKAEHDGYCSDQGEELYTRNYRLELEYQIPKFITDESFDSKGNLISNLEYFQKVESNHCSCAPSYEIVSARRVKV